MRRTSATAAALLGACLALGAVPAAAAEGSTADSEVITVPSGPTRAPSVQARSTSWLPDARALPPDPEPRTPAAPSTPTGPPDPADVPAQPAPEPAPAPPADPGTSTPSTEPGAPLRTPSPPGQAAPLPTSSPPPAIGYDVSWPQCATALPTGQAFGIVGVNGGRANTTNPCLRAQLAWAAGSTGSTSQPTVALYANTANPGAAAASWWPRSNTYPAWSATPVANPYGQCTGTDTAACAYMYGYAKAHDNATVRGVPNPASYFWWLDVETENSWGPDVAANRAVLEGMTHYYLDVLGAAGVGIYSTGRQWTQIIGGTGPVVSGTVSRGPSNLNGLPSWLAGATTLAGAKANCADPSLTGGVVTLTQYLTNNLDHNYSCR